MCLSSLTQPWVTHPQLFSACVPSTTSLAVYPSVAQSDGWCSRGHRRTHWRLNGCLFLLCLSVCCMQIDSKCSKVTDHCNRHYFLLSAQGKFPNLEGDLVAFCFRVRDIRNLSSSGLFSGVLTYIRLKSINSKLGKRLSPRTNINSI